MSRIKSILLFIKDFILILLSYILAIVFVAIVTFILLTK